eukprot:2492096-Pyramimonas_sp.AAC.1
MIAALSKGAVAWWKLFGAQVFRGKVLPSSTSSSSGRKPPYPPLPRPCARGCRNLSGTGSTARFVSLR